MSSGNLPNPLQLIANISPARAKDADGGNLLLVLDHNVSTELTFVGEYAPPSYTDVELTFTGGAIVEVKPVKTSIVLNYSQVFSFELSVPVSVRVGLTYSHNLVFDLSTPPAPPADARVTLNYPAPTLTFKTHYDSLVNRFVESTTDTVFEKADRHTRNYVVPWEVAREFPKRWGVPYETCASLADTREIPWASTLRANAPEDSLVWENADHVEDSRDIPWEAGIWVAPEPAHIPWEDTLNVGKAYVIPWEEMIYMKGMRRTPWDIALNLSKEIVLPYTDGRVLSVIKEIPWEDAITPPPGRSWVTPEPPEPPSDKFQPTTIIQFRCLLSDYSGGYVDIVFGQDCTGINVIIPKLKVYIVPNDLLFIRVSDGMPITLFSVNVSIDTSSWAWSFTGSIPSRELWKVQPNENGAVEVELVINEYTWRFLVEGYDDTQEFNAATASIKGRSVTAYLDDPYALKRSYAVSVPTAVRQLAEQELNRSPVPGFSLGWNLVEEDITQWILEANAYSYTNLTPMNVISAIAEGAKGFVNSDSFLKKLWVQSMYPKGPYWGWGDASPDVVIPREVVLRESLSWLQKPDYNGVYVVGENAGVTAFVKRLESDGAIQAEMFTNPFITGNAPAREAGTSIISSGGKQATVTIDMPLFQAMGVVIPGYLLKMDNNGHNIPSWVGMTRSVSVAGSWSDTEGLSVVQSIGIERHY